MIGTQTDHFEIVARSLSGERSVDEHTLASAGVLNGKVERLRQSHPIFSGIALSPEARELAEAGAATVI